MRVWNDPFSVERPLLCGSTLNTGLTLTVRMTFIVGATLIVLSDLLSGGYFPIITRSTQ